MNPLEDVYVAVKAVRPVTPFGVPQSNRLLDPAQVDGSQLGFTQIDPTTGQAPATPFKNKIFNFDNEYVWHCHILGHEELDFMRPFIFHPTVVVPDAPAAVTISGATVSWTDTTPYGGQDAQGIPTAGTNAAYPEPTSSPKNEIGFKVYSGATLLATLSANVTSWTDPAGTNVPAGATVVAYNVAGNSLPGSAGTTTAAGNLVGTGTVTASNSGTAAASTGPAGPSGLTQTVNADGTVTLTWTPIAGATGYVVTVNGVTQPAVTGTSFTVPKASLVAGTVNTFSVTAVTLSGSTEAVTTSVYDGAAKSALGFTASQGNQGNGSPPGSITVDWANNPVNVNNLSNFTLTWTQGGSTTPTGTVSFAPTVTGATIINLARDKNYTFRLQANSNFGNSPVVSAVGLSAP